MSTEPPAVPPVFPNPVIPKTIGMLNIVFGTILLLCGVCGGVYAYVAQSAQAKIFSVTAGNQTVQVQALEDEEKKAATEEEKKAIRAQIDEQREGEELMRELSTTGSTFQEPLRNYMLLDVGTAFVLNTLMVISGIGLVVLRDWARRLAIWVAGVKIFRLLVLCVIFVMVVVPLLVKTVGTTFDRFEKIERKQMAKRAAAAAKQPGASANAVVVPLGPAATPFGNPQMRVAMSQTLTAMYTAVSVVVTLLGVIYPAISLWFLTRPVSKAAVDRAGLEL